MLMPVGKEPLEGISTAYSFELTVDAAQHASAEGTWPIKLMAEDESNAKLQIDALGGALIRLDFTPPMAECSLVPAASPYPVGEKVTLVVSPLEELAPDTVPELFEDFTPPEAMPWFIYEDATTYQFSAVVTEEMVGKTFELSLEMTDLVGNQTPPGETACAAGVLSGSLGE